jgi:hypothetical protein
MPYWCNRDIPTKKKTIEFFQANLGKTLDQEEKIDMIIRKKELTLLYKIVL